MIGERSEGGQHFVVPAYTCTSMPRKNWMVPAQGLFTQLVYKICCSADPATNFKITNPDFLRVFLTDQIVFQEKDKNNNKTRILSFVIGCCIRWARYVFLFSYVSFINIKGCIIPTGFVFVPQFALQNTAGIKEFDISVQIRGRWSPGQDKSNIRSLKEQESIQQLIYRVYQSELVETKWPWGIEGSTFFLN